ncbi:MAG: hypothetical protein ACPGWR_01685 [Ardenticatenaceae bacterium]
MLHERQFNVPPTDESAVVIYEQDGVTVKAFRVSHEPIDPAVGYRIEFAGKVVVISGDTVRTTSLLEQSQNADLLGLRHEHGDCADDATRQ